MVDATMVGSDWLRNRLEAASPDLLREMVATFIAALMGAEADALCGAGYGESSPDRVNCRNGYRHRDLDTRVGTLDVGIPKLRSGSYFPDWLVAPRRRAEQALVSVVATCYLLGVSTRRMEKLVATLGIDKCVQVPGLRAGQEPGRPGGGLSEPAAGRRALHLLLDRRAGDAGARRRPDRQRLGADRHRSQRRRAPGDPRPSRWPPERAAPAGWRSAAAWSPAAWPACSWSSPTPTKASRGRSRPPCPARAGGAAAPTGLVKSQLVGVSGTGFGSETEARSAAAVANRVAAGRAV